MILNGGPGEVLLFSALITKTLIWAFSQLEKSHVDSFWSVPLPHLFCNRSTSQLHYVRALAYNSPHERTFEELAGRPERTNVQTQTNCRRKASATRAKGKVDDYLHQWQAKAGP